MLESKSYPNKKLNPPANVSAQEDVLTNNSTRNEKKIEWHEICFLMLLGVLFGVVDNLFVGYFIWQHFGFIIFVAISLISIPITSVFKYFSYKNLYRQKTEFISDLFCLEKCRNYITNPANTLKILFLIVSIVSALILYNIYYGALFIQILGLFRNEMGISSLTASYLTMSLVFSSIIPDAISYIKDQYGRISSIFSSVDNPIIKLFDDNPRQKIFLILFVILLSYIFAQIEFTQIINSYQHYLIEVLEVIIPIVANKMFLFALILITNFSILYGMACNFLQGIHAYAISIQEYISGESTQKITANNVLEFLMFFIIVTIRAIGRSLAAGQLAINPYNIDAKNIALFFSVIFDL